MRVEVLEKTEVYAVAVWRRMMLLLWRGPIQAIGIDRSQALFREWAEGQPGGAALFVVVPRPPGPPDEETRAAMSRAVEHLPPTLKGMGTLLEAQGFIAASIRSILLRAHQREARGAGPKVFRAVDEAALWAAELLGDPGITTEALAGAIRAARAG